MLNYSIIHKWKTSTPTYKLPGPKCNPQIIQPRWPLCNFLTAATKYILSHAQIQRLNFIQNCYIFKKTSKSPLEESTNLHRFKSADTGFERRSRDRDVHTSQLWCRSLIISWVFEDFNKTNNTLKEESTSQAQARLKSSGCDRSLNPPWRESWWRRRSQGPFRSRGVPLARLWCTAASTRRAPSHSLFQRSFTTGGRKCLPVQLRSSGSFGVKATRL